ncbi:unnamed protein product [Angiostrongylus costaricensis]|uniref:TPR_REGION domain-containing protein n=1 Tax=Angiostrongylus costaricensis TaxID=334426 RepID=A0A0R3PQG8_ANGCS|nr:unnamed protein product [Angiostrongylus costaricensis]
MEKVNEGASPTCFKLARKGETLCLEHKFYDAIATLLEALALGTDDLSILSVIYCQLGFSYYSVQDFQNAYKYYCYDIVISRLMNDKVSECRGYGNVGVVLKAQKLFTNAIMFINRQVAIAEAIEDERLVIASEFHDTESQYIACINIGNACFQRCNSNEAMRYYEAALKLAVEISSRSKKSKCYFCLMRAAYSIQDYPRAEMCCLNYLALARELNDFISMFRAYHWLARVYEKLGDYPKAVYFLACFRALAVEIHDKNLATFAVKILKQFVQQYSCFVVSEEGSIKFDSSRDPEPQSHVCFVKTVSGSTILKSTNQPSSPLLYFNGIAQEEKHHLESASAAPRKSEDTFLDLVSRVQSSRLDEQRCDISIMSSRTVAGRRKTDSRMVTPNDCENNANIEEVSTIGETLGSNAEQSPERKKCHYAKKNTHDPESRRSLVDPVLDSQAEKMNEQPAVLLPGLKIEKENLDIINKLRCTSEEGGDSRIDEALIDLLINAQEQRMNDQRSDLVTVSNNNHVDCGSLDDLSVEEELSVMVMRMQAGRLEDQRAHLKTTKKP